MFICVCLQDVRVCLWERECEVWCHCLYPPVGLQKAPHTKRASHPSLLKSETDHVSLTTAGLGQFLADYGKAVTSPDISGGSLSVMSGCDGSILRHRREAGVTCWGKGAEQLAISHTQATVADLQLICITSPGDETPITHW